MTNTHTSGGIGHPVPVIPIGKLKLKIPLYPSISAGFPSPADDYLEENLDLGEYLVKNPAATFFIRVSGDSMINAGIYPNDILIVDRSVRAADGDVIIAVLNTEFTVKRLYHKNGVVKLVPENGKYKSTSIEEGDQFQIWGVVAHVIHKPTRR